MIGETIVGQGGEGGAVEIGCGRIPGQVERPQVLSVATLPAPQEETETEDKAHASLADPEPDHDGVADG